MKINYNLIVITNEDGHTETVKVLLKAHLTYGFPQRADVRAKDDYALRWAAHCGHEETVQTLLLAGANSARLSFQHLKKFLTPKFILSLPQDIIVGIETSHPEVKEQYRWREKRTLLNSDEREIFFDAKISLADLYYRPGSPGYYQAICL